MIQTTQPLLHPALPGVSIFPFGDKPKRGTDQQVLVVMDPTSRIPLHRHTVDASMFIVAGSARLLSDEEHNGQIVLVGDRVDFIRQRDHGFEAGPQGMAFVSTNGGIVDAGGNWDLAMEGGEKL